MKLYQFAIVITSCIIGCKQNTKISDSKQINVDLNSLQGTWRNTISQSADFRIFKDTMFFLQEVNQPGFPYLIKEDSLIIVFPTFTYKFRVIRFDGDSMHLLDEQNSNSFHKL